MLYILKNKGYNKPGKNQVVFDIWKNNAMQETRVIYWCIPFVLLHVVEHIKESQITDK